MPRDFLHDIIEFFMSSNKENFVIFHIIYLMKNCIENCDVFINSLLGPGHQNDFLVARDSKIFSPLL
ncbi:hypothetical protein EGR_07857 [Echinococcus granulosus]|uniref:Uncharacterized protein n=1 Tax=Echinococcus granulosus TaxID=6210 RepID=W6U9X0_ECHGR|nr:hypothetical protein EGR_07857 [Echinococcus granulosus]EUB57321.1 hypothetical protein EGR_07857 [Echinococcus granulosus]